MTYKIPFNKPCLTGGEFRYVADAIERGSIAGDGAYARKCRDLLERELGAAGALLTTSCTHALEMSALLLNIRPGDEVIAPSFTFVSTVNAFALRGAKPVFADIRPDTLNLDETQLPAWITPRTRAIIPVHYAGVGCEMDAILRIAENRGIPVVEDNAHGLFARYKGKYLGTFGAMATQSFHETKNLVCGEGGALIINDEELVERAEILREKGTNRSRYYRGQVDKYTWVDLGSSYVPSDILAAFLLAQLQQRKKVAARRRAIWTNYHRNLKEWADRNGVIQPTVPAHCEQSFHMYYLLMPSLADRQALIENLRARGILAVFHYVPLHLSKMGMAYGGREGSCPVTEWVSDRLVRLPFYNDMTESEQAEVIEAVSRFTVLPKAVSVSGRFRAA